MVFAEVSSVQTGAGGAASIRPNGRSHSI